MSGPTYTELAGLAVAGAVAADLVVLRSRVLATRTFWASYCIVLFFQLITDGVLTGYGIVGYDPAAIIGWRLAWAPVEDLAFGFALVVWTLSWWALWGRRGVQRTPVAGPPRRRRSPTPTAKL